MNLDLQTTGMEFASEMVVKASLNQLKISEVPTTLQPDGRTRPPHLRSWRDGWRHLRFLMLYSPRWLFLYPGLFLMVAGLVLGAVILRGSVIVDGAHLGIHTLLIASVMIIAGFQILFFAIATKVFAIQEHLLPSDPWLGGVMKHVSLEMGLISGVILFFIGLAISWYTVTYWRSQAFGQLNPEQTMRYFIPGITVLVLGVQMIFASFFLSIMGLKRSNVTE